MPPKKKSRKSSPKKETKRSKSAGVKATHKQKAKRNTPKIDALGDIEREFQNRGVTDQGRATTPSDFEGLSRAEEADSESVEELVEEGNVFESGAVAGVERADNEDEREVHTRELPEDDVPEEYLEDE